MQALGPRIKQLRLEAGLNKAALARLVGVSDVTISYWESGAIKQIGHERLVALANAFGYPLDELLSDRAPETARIFTLTATPPAPWEAHPRQHVSLPASMLDDTHLSAECYLVTAGTGEKIDFLEVGDLAAIAPLATFQRPGLYLIEHQQRLMIRQLQQGPTGELLMLRSGQALGEAATADASLRLYGKVQARWRLGEA
ncbi:helix-turn-helix transcriptional regulator [Franzmannia qiaohouensis]|uniref:Helix-turn-helix transcriptional regulator n=1 Tax=Franzmannia qiaohouensis TaxID=1329370 RepID=A0ABU1HAC9_9GAMM|nr:helix-turn-helix transcriptional regulator [Halomonas qiaohouensis]MDR5904413.1 helix-turn-helix transcriptional regulator [Halomonas qiaohouensis]